MIRKQALQAPWILALTLTVLGGILLGGLPASAGEPGTPDEWHGKAPADGGTGIVLPTEDKEGSKNGGGNDADPEWFTIESWTGHDLVTEQPARAERRNPIRIWIQAIRWLRLQSQQYSLIGR